MLATRLKKPSLWARFCADENGTTAIEYSLIAIGISVVIVASVNSIGSSVSDLYVEVEEGYNQ